MARKLTKQEYSKLVTRGAENDDEQQQHQLEKGVATHQQQRKRTALSQVSTQVGDDDRYDDDDDDDYNDDDSEQFDPDTGVMSAFFPRRRAGALFLAALAFMTVLFLLIVYLVVRRNQLMQALESTTRSWRDAFPDDVVAMIDDRVDPCDDFYAFACGKWVAETEIPPERASVYASFTRVQDQNEAALRAIVAENWPLLGELYNSCMNVSAINATGIAPLRAGLQRIALVHTKHELFELAGALAQTGPDFLTGLGVSPDAKDATKYALYVSQAGLTLPDPTYYLDAERFRDVESDFHAFVAAMFTLSGAADATNAALVVAFERALAHTFIPKEQLTDPTKTYNVVNTSDAAVQYPLLFGAYLNGTGIAAIVANASHATTSAALTTVVVETPAYFAAAETLVRETELATLRAVLTYQYIQHFAATLPEPFVAAVFALFRQKLLGQQQRSPRWKVCLHQVTAFFPNLVGKYYFLKLFDSKGEASAIDLVAQIERAMLERLAALPWLDAPTRAAAVKKLARVSNLVGHATQYELFPFVLSPTHLASNVQTLARHRFVKTVARIGQRVDRDEWFMTAADVNAYYNPSGNQIVFPAGILQPPFFASTHHAARNYGAIGSIIGHELTHGFDSQGRNYDGDGNLVSWWSNATEREFTKRAQCLVDQYNAFPVASAFDTTRVLGHVNGNFTLGENIADNGGIKLAFSAFQRAHAAASAGDAQTATAAAAERSGGSTQAPHMSTANAEKLFFVAFAQAFCAKSSDAAMVRRLSTDPHAPEQWRINGVMMNSDEFASTFACPRGAKMNPATKCKLW